MSLFGQIKSILNKNGTQPLGKEYPPSSPIDRRRSRRFSHTGRRILVVDDSATVVASLGKVLRSAGCVVREAGDAETGLEIARGEQPDLIFLDIVLPGMNGFAALRQIRRDPRLRRIPVIIISGNEQATEQFYAQRIGADDFMRKPFSRREVFAHVETLVTAEKLPRLDAATEPTQRQSETGISAPATATASSGQSPLDVPSPEEKTTTENLSNAVIAGMTALEARRQLTSMGLQYFSQEQFSAAVARGDRLAVDLFVIGGGVEIHG